MYICIYIYMYIYICVHIYVYIYIWVCPKIPLNPLHIVISHQIAITGAISHFQTGSYVNTIDISYCLTNAFGVGMIFLLMGGSLKNMSPMPSQTSCCQKRKVCPWLLKITCQVDNNWLVVWTPLKHISQLGWFPIYGKIEMFQTTNQVQRKITVNGNLTWCYYGQAEKIVKHIDKPCFVGAFFWHRPVSLVLFLWFLYAGFVFGICSGHCLRSNHGRK